MLTVAALPPSALLIPYSAKADDTQRVSEWAIDISTIVEGAQPTKRSAITPAEIFRGSGATDYFGRANIIGGQVTGYKTPDERISVSLVEYRQHRWAVLGTTYKKATPVPQAAPGASFGWVRRNNTRALGIAGTKGRIGIEVWVVSPAGSALTESAQFKLTAKLYSRQFVAVPMLPDLRSSPTQVGQRFAEHLGIGLLVAGLVLAAAGWLVGWGSDVGSREWLRNNRRGDRSQPGLVDVTPTVRRGMVLRSLVPAVRMGMLAAVEGILLAIPGVRVFFSLLLVGAFTLVWGFFESTLRRRKAKRAVARGRVAAIVTGLGAGISATVAAAGLAFMSAGVSAKLLLADISGTRIWVPLLLLGFAVISWSRRPVRLARRLLQPVVRRQIKADVRLQTILLLRSFQDDTLEVRPSIAVGTRDGFAEEPYVRFEEMVAWEAWQFGPLRAVGQPGTVLQPLGAVRDYYSDDDWQTAVEKGAEDAKAIILIVGRSPGLVWEIENLRAHSRLAKTVFVIPPVPQEETARRLEVLVSALDLDPARMIQPSGGRTPLALTFNEDGRPLTYAAAGRTSDAYCVALSHALTSVPDQPRPVSGPASDFRRAGADITEHLVAFDPHDQVSSRKPLITRLAGAALWLFLV